MFKWQLILLLVCTGFISEAQTITGRVAGSRHQPMMSVSVILQKDSQLVVAATTDEKGFFRLTAALKNEQAYTLQCSLVGYTTRAISFTYPDTAALDEIILTEDAKMLAEVSVTGKQPLVIHKTDRYIVKVENGPLANGFSATEVLQRSPGVWVDNLGNIRLKGTQPVTIMINDVVQRLDSEALADFLRSLKSEDISRIEIIANPPAEFEAGGSGGIIHIILKKGKKNGWNGSANTQYWQQANKPYFTTGATINYQLHKLYVSGSYTFSKDLRSITEKTSISYPDHSSFYNFTHRDETIGRLQYRLAAVYDFNDRQSISVQSVFSKIRFRQHFQSNETYFSRLSTTGNATSQKQRVFDVAGITLNYSFKLDTSGSLLSIIADVVETKRAEENEFNKIKNDSTLQRFWRTDAPNNTTIYTLQSDFTKVLRSKTTFKSGIKYAAIKRDNQLTTDDLVDDLWIKNPGQSNHFVYTENILMLYTSLERTLKRTVIKAGLRAEETFSSGNEIGSATTFSRQYFGLFPSFFVMQPLHPERGTAITASYSRRLTRPSLSELNPARLEFSNYTSVTGNPNLQPQYSHHFSLEYQFIKNHSVETYFIRTNNYIALSANPGINNAIDYYVENTGSTTQYGLGYNSTISPLPSWTITNNFSAFRLSYRFNHKPYQQITFYASSLHTFTIKSIGDLDLTADYQSPFIYTNLYTYGNLNTDIGFTKKFFKGKAIVRLAVTDILNTSREKEWTDDEGTTISFYRKRPTRTARLSFSYYFNSGKKMQNKNIDQGSNEEKKRIGN